MLWTFLFDNSLVFYLTPKVYHFYLKKQQFLQMFFELGKLFLKIYILDLSVILLKLKSLLTNSFILNKRFYRFIKVATHKEL